MGRQWVCALGLGRFYKSSNAFHRFCREQDVEGRVKAGVANGFTLQSEMEEAWKQSQLDTPVTDTKEGKGCKRKASADTVTGKKAKIKKEKKEHREPEVDCNTLEGKTIWRNFKEACSHYKFPGSHQVHYHVVFFFGCALPF
jgi:hypothetical protein